MIQSFRCKDTEALFNLRAAVRWQALAKVALRKLDQVNAATTLNDLRIPPANRLEPLHGGRAGQHSIRVNDQWRVCFRWEGGHAYDVEIVDYP